VVVPIVGITRLAEESLTAALSLGDRVVALHVVLGDEADDRAAAAADVGVVAAQQGPRPA
jgi:hypothetical protein